VQNGDTFVLGMKLFELAHELPPMNRLLKEALPRMEALAKAVDQSCHLTVLSGPRQLVVAQVDTPEGVGFSVKIGAMLDLLKSASGRVLLAFRDQEETRHLISLADPKLNLAERKNLLSRGLLPRLNVSRGDRRRPADFWNSCPTCRPSAHIRSMIGRRGRNSFRSGILLLVRSA